MTSSDINPQIFAEKLDKGVLFSLESLSRMDVSLGRLVAILSSNLKSLPENVNSEESKTKR